MFSFMQKLKTLLPAERTLPGRAAQMPAPERHFVSGHPLKAPFPVGMQQTLFGMGCFWGAERLFWETSGVYTTAVGYAGGETPNPGYEEVCSGLTNHTEAVLVVFDPGAISYEALLKVFWEGHDPTQGMRQGNDVGTQYRSGIYTYSAEQRRLAETSKAEYEKALAARRKLEDFEKMIGDEAQKFLSFKAHLPFKFLTDIIRHPRILDAVEDVIGPNILCWGSSFFQKNACILYTSDAADE